MRPLLKETPIDTQGSASFSIHRMEETMNNKLLWHYHSKYEIAYVYQGGGLRLVGDSIGNYERGDIVFISPGLPHVWKIDNEGYVEEGKKLEMYLLHFDEEFFNKGLFNPPEMSGIKKLLQYGKRGLRVKGKAAKHISLLFQKEYDATGLDSLILFLKIINELVKARDYELLASRNCHTETLESKSRKIEKVLGRIVQNYNRHLLLEEMAETTSMSKSSFCRYFKSETGKTYTQFLNELRIAKACELLVNTDMAVARICYETGFNNISHFNKQFRRYKGYAAMEYRKMHSILTAV